MSIVQTQLQNDVGIVIMNNPERRNTLSSKMVCEMLNAFEVLERGKARVIILRAHTGA